MNKMFLLIFCLCTMYGTSVYAHRDRIIQLDEAGNMIGLPDNYLPARIDFDKERISIGKATINMPSCLSKYFFNRQSYNLKITSSWYHQRSKLPPYINFDISPVGEDYGYSLLFSLDNLSYISSDVIANGREDHKMLVDDLCLQKLKKSYTIDHP